MPLIEFDNSLKLGISEIDKQHQKWIGLINKLYDEIDNQEVTVYSVKKSIDDMPDYAATHFFHEIDCLKKYNYKELDSHINEHKNFLKSVEELKSKYKPGQSELAMEILNFMIDWVIEHIKKKDMKFKEVLLANGMQ